MITHYTLLISWYRSLAIDALGNRGFKPALYYFFCRRDGNRPEQAVNVLRSIIRQLFWAMPSHNPVETLYKDWESDGFARATFNVKKLFSLMRQCLAILSRQSITRRTFILIDGLDECDPLSRHQLIQIIRTLESDTCIQAKFFVTSRRRTEVALGLENCRKICITPSYSLSDIVRFVLSEVDKAISEKRLLKGDVMNETRGKIVSTLVNDSGGS